MRNRLLTFILIGCVLISQEVNAVSTVAETPVVLIKNIPAFKPVETKLPVKQPIDKTATPIIKPTVESAAKLAPAAKQTVQDFALKQTETTNQFQSQQAPKQGIQQHVSLVGQHQFSSQAGQDAQTQKAGQHASSQNAGQHYQSQKAGQKPLVQSSISQYKHFSNSGSVRKQTTTRVKSHKKSSTVKGKSIQHRNKVHH